MSAALLKLGIRTYEGLEEYAESQDQARRNVDVWNATLYEIEGGLREVSTSGGVVTAVDASKLRSDKEALSEQLAKLSEGVQRKEAQLDGIEVDEMLPDIEAEIERVTGEITGLERHIRVLGLTRTSLTSAMTMANEEAATVLEPIVGRVLSRATLGRYSHVSVANDLDLSVSSPSGSPDTPERMDTADLSRGTLDQLYLAARYALLEFLSPGDGSPLILDDALVHWDPNRRSATLELLDEISEKRQVLLFTCEGYGSEFADSLVLLPGA